MNEGEITRLLIEKFTYKIKMAVRTCTLVDRLPQQDNPIQPAQISVPIPGWKGCPNVNNRYKKTPNKHTRDHGPRFTAKIPGDAFTRATTYMRRAMEARRTIGGMMLGNPDRPGDEAMSDEMIFDFIMQSIPPDMAESFAPQIKDAVMAELRTARNNITQNCARNISDLLDWDGARNRRPGEFGETHQKYYDDIAPHDRDSHYEWIRIPVRREIAGPSDAKRPTYVHGLTGCDLHSAMFCDRLGISHSDNTEFGGDSNKWGSAHRNAGARALGVYCMPMEAADTAAGYSYGTTFGEDQTRFCFLLELKAKNENETKYNIDTKPKQKCFDAHGGNTGNFGMSALWISSCTIERMHHQEQDQNGKYQNYTTYWNIWEDNLRHGFPGEYETHPFTPWILYFPSDTPLKMGISLRVNMKKTIGASGSTDPTTGGSSGDDVEYAEPITATESDEVTELSSAIEAYILANQPPLDKIIYSGKITGFHEGKPDADKMRTHADAWRNFLETFIEYYLIPNLPTQDAIEVYNKMSQIRSDGMQYSTKSGKPVNNVQYVTNNMRVLAEAILASVGDHVTRVNLHMMLVHGNPPPKRDAIKTDKLMNVSTVTFGDSLFDLYKSTYSTAHAKHVTRERTSPIENITKKYLTEYAGSKVFPQEKIALASYRHFKTKEGSATIEWILENCDTMIRNMGDCHALKDKYKNACGEGRCHPGPRIAVVAYCGSDLQDQNYRLISQQKYEHEKVPAMRKLCIKLRDSFDRAVFVWGPMAEFIRYQGQPSVGTKAEDEKVFNLRFNGLAQIARDYNIPVISSQRLYETCGRADAWHMYDTEDNTARVGEFWCRIVWSQVESMAMSPAGMQIKTLQDIVRPGVQAVRGREHPVVITRMPSNLPRVAKRSAVSFMGAKTDITKDLNILKTASVTTLFDMLDIDNRKKNEIKRMTQKAEEAKRRGEEPGNTDPGNPFVRMLSGVPECLCINCKTIQACVVPGTCTECNALDSLLPIFRLEHVNDDLCYGLKRPIRVLDTSNMSKYHDPVAQIYNLNTLSGRAECCREQIKSQGFDTFMEDQFEGMNNAYLVDEPSSMNTDLTSEETAELERRVEVVQKGGSNKLDPNRASAGRWRNAQASVAERPSDEPEPAKQSPAIGKPPPASLQRPPLLWNLVQVAGPLHLVGLLQSFGLFCHHVCQVRNIGWNRRWGRVIRVIFIICQPHPLLIVPSWVMKLS